MRSPVGQIMLKLTIAIVVVVASFLVTMKVLEYLGTSQESNVAPPQPTYALASLPRIKIGEIVKFGVGADNRALLSGWSSPEVGGIWSLGKDSVIGFVVHCEPAICNSDHLAVLFEGGAFVVSNHPQQTIEFWVGAKAISKVTFPLAGAGNKFAVDLNGVIVKDGSPVILSLHLPDAIAPASVSNSPDARQLGFRIGNLQLTLPGREGRG